MARPKPTLFHPQFPKKYEGNVNQIVCRSSWELKLCARLDVAKNVVSWSSEPGPIPYHDKSSGKLRRYWVDFKVTTRNKDGSLQVSLIEVKPAKEAMPPTPEGKTKKRYMTECLLWAKNHSKWEAAKRVCAEKGWEFKIFTEKELGIIF